MPIQVLVTLLLIQLPDNVLEKAVEDAPRTWVLMRNLDVVLGSCIQPGMSLALVGF